MANPTVDEILSSFFTSTCLGRQIPTQARYLRVEDQLRLYLETDGWRHLPPEAAALLQLERAFDAESAFVRLFRAEDLLHALGGFLEPQWLLPGLQDRRTQISLTPRLLQWLCNCRLVNPRRNRWVIQSTRAAAAWARKGPAYGSPDKL